MFIGLGKSSERSEKKSLGSKCVSIAPDSNFEFLFLFITVQIAMTCAVNWEKKSSLTFVGETRGEKKKSLGGRGFLLLLPSLSNFEICVALISVNLHRDTVNMKNYFF